MKTKLLILLLVAMGFNCMARNDKDIDNIEVNKLSNELENQVLKPMRISAESLLADIQAAQALYSQLKDRSYARSTSSQAIDQMLAVYLSVHSFNDLFEEKDNEGWVEWTVKKIVASNIANSPDSDFKNAYVKAISMKEYLNAPYDEGKNKQFLKDVAEVRNNILPKHIADFDILVKQIKDYEFYMYELARMFEAARNDNFKRSAEELVKAENAKELLAVPFTSNMLKLYIDEKGELGRKEKFELKKACSDAFSEVLK